MIATKDRKVFGDASKDPRVQVNLPSVLKASTLNPSIEFFWSLLKDKSTNIVAFPH